jgi:hypothetical protein
MIVCARGEESDAHWAENAHHGRAAPAREPMSLLPSLVYHLCPAGQVLALSRLRHPIPRGWIKQNDDDDLVSLAHLVHHSISADRGHRTMADPRDELEQLF